MAIVKTQAFSTRRTMLLVTGTAMLGGVQTARALDPLSALLVAEPSFRAAESGFRALQAGVQAIDAIVRLTYTIAGRPLDRPVLQFGQMNERLEALQAELARFSGEILGAIEQAPQKMLFHEAYSLHTRISLRTGALAGLQARGEDAARPLTEELRSLQGELERLTFFAAGMRGTTDQLGVHYVAALHGLSLGLAQLVDVAGAARAPAVGPILTRMASELDGALVAASQSGAFLDRTARREWDAYVAGLASLEADSRTAALIRGVRGGGAGQVCLQSSESFQDGTRIERICRNALFSTQTGFFGQHCTNEVRPVMRARLTHAEFPYSVDALSAGPGRHVLGPLRPGEPRPVRLMEQRGTDLCIPVEGGNPASTWRELVRSFNQAIAIAQPAGGRAAIALKSLELVAGARTQLAVLKLTR